MNRLRILILFLIPVFSSAQKIPDVSIDMLQEVQHADSSAHAAYLLKNCDIEFVFTSDNILITYKIRKRIKIYDDEGLSYADFNVSLFNQGGRKELLTKIKAKTYNLVNGKIEKTDLHRKKDVYEEQSSENWKQVKFAMPNVKAGSIVDVEYFVRSPYIYQLDRWHFQEDIPVAYSQYKIRAPEYFTYTPVPKGHHPLTPTKTPLTGSPHGEVDYVFVAKDIPALKDDEFILSKNDYRSSIKFELYATQFPNQNVKYYSKDWNKIAEQLLTSKNFGKEINRKLKNIDFDFDHSLGLEKEERIKYIYDYVRQNYTWDDTYGISSRDGLKNFIEKKSGSIGDINLLLLNLLDKGGINAHPLVSKARHSGLLNEHYPTVTDLNYLMAYIPQEDGTYQLLDASSKYSPMGQIPRRAINTTGVVLYESLGDVIYFSVDDKYMTATMASYDIDVDNVELVGEAERVRDGYSALSYRLSLEDTDNADTEDEPDDSEGIDDVDEAVEVKNEYTMTTVEHADDIYKKVKQEYTEIIREEIKKIGNNIFIDASLDFGMSENPFKEETRDYPVFYHYPRDIKNIVTLHIPEGYHFESMPEPLALSLPNKSASFKFNVQEQDNKIIIYHLFSIKKSIFLDSEYPDLKEFYNRIIQKNSEKFVLVKTVP